jgi:hypothetical protein
MASNLSTAEAFIRVSLTGVGPMIDILDLLIGSFGKGAVLEKVLREAAIPIRDEYKSRALTHDATGNLAKSTTIKTKTYPSGISIAVAGPRHTGSAGATGKMASGNHSWLVEFGSNGRRQPSTRNRKTYVNVHKMINRKMTVHARLEDSEKFAKRSRGYYFLMSSWHEPTRQPRRGKGYPHDFLPDIGKGPRVYTLHPGETYGAMPGYGLMQKTIAAQSANVRNILRSGIVDAINDTISGSI